MGALLTGATKSSGLIFPAATLANDDLVDPLLNDADEIAGKAPA